MENTKLRIKISKNNEKEKRSKILEKKVDREEKLCDNEFTKWKIFPVIFIQYLTGRTVHMREGCLLICLAAAGLWDFRVGRIPNLWLGFWFAVGFGVFVCSGWPAAAGYLVRTVAAVGILFLFFLCRMMGAGDIKCMALICGYLGIPSGIRVIGLGMVIGAVWSFFRLTGKGLAGKRMRYLFAYIGQVFLEKRIIAYYVPERDGRDVVLPLAVCLFLGYGLYLALNFYR